MIDIASSSLDKFIQWNFPIMDNLGADILSCIASYLLSEVESDMSVKSCI